jgi:DNA-binding response OmpR family regulator
MRLLLAEDDAQMARFIGKGLREQSYAVDIAADGKQALYLTEVNEYDLAILDVKLPLKDGFSVCRELRKKSFPGTILLLTALDDAEDIVCGLNCGADDYLPKPFDFRILLARIHALLRRVQKNVSSTITVGDLVLNTLNHAMSRAGRGIRLTAKEYALIEYFMLHPGETLRREDIAKHVWSEDFDPFSNVIDVYMNRLRKKLDAGSEQHLLHTIRNEGYVLSIPPRSARA